jgi:hypothetical protein
MGWLTGSAIAILHRVSPAAGGTAGLFGGYGLTQSSLIALAAALFLAVVACAPKIFESIYRRRPAIIHEKGEARAKTTEAQAKKIQAVSEAKALKKRTSAQARLLRSGMKQGMADQAIALLRQQAIDPDLPEGRRPSDELLGRLLAPSKTRNNDTKPGTRPPNVHQIRPLVPCHSTEGPLLFRTGDPIGFSPERTGESVEGEILHSGI